jgi:hypothetical protein
MLLVQSQGHVTGFDPVLGHRHSLCCEVYLEGLEGF